MAINKYTDRTVLSGGINVTSSVPLDARDKIDSLSDLGNISNPDVGGIFYCVSTGFYYIITSVTEEGTIDNYSLLTTNGATGIKINGEVIDREVGSQGVTIPDDTADINKSVEDRDSICINLTSRNGGISFSSLSSAISKFPGTPKDGQKIKYKESGSNMWKEYIYLAGTWTESGSWGCIDYSEIKNYANQTMNSAGTWSYNQSGLYSSYYIQVSSSDWVRYTGTTGSSSIPEILYFDKDYELVSYGTYSTSTFTKYLPISDNPGTKYIVLQWKGSSKEFQVLSPNTRPTQSSKIIDLSERVDEAYKEIGHKEVASWDTSSTNPQCSYKVGDRDICDKETIFLVKVYSETVDEETSSKVKIIGELQGNNLFKFKNGEYAPTVVITEAAYAETNQDLYGTPSATDLKYAQGKFDPVDWWIKSEKKEVPLYDSAGKEVYVRKPWETVDLGYDIVIGWKEKFWMLGGEFTESGDTVFGFFSKPTYYKGLLGKEVEPTGYCLDLPTVYRSGKGLRCMYFKDSSTDSSCKSSVGQSSLLDFRRQDRCYPRVNVNQISTMQLARVRNTSTTSSLPCSEGMAFHKLSHIYADFIRTGRYDLHNDNLWGPGISSNIGPGSSTWDSLSGGSGVKYSLDGGTTWSYQTFGATPSGFNVTANSTTTYSWNYWLKLEYPILLTLEPQMALSWATECEISEGDLYTFDGQDYQYKNIPGIPTLLEDTKTMNARLVKRLQFSEKTVYLKGTSDQAPLEGEVKLGIPVCYGMYLWGDVFDYGYAGLECVVDVKDSTSSGSKYTNPYTLFLCSHQKDLAYEASVNKDYPFFEFEGIYEKIGSGIRSGEGWSKNVWPYSIVPTEKGGAGMYTGSCSYSTNYDYSGWFNNVGQHYRAAMRGRGYASWGHCSARAWYGYLSVSSSNRHYAPSLQVFLGDSNNEIE